MTNLIDIIIPIYNISNDALSSCLMSIFVQTCADSCKITIIDDGSTNFDYQKVIEDAGVRDIQILRLDVNSGPGVARQYGLDHTDREYILFLDADDVLVADCALESLWKTFENDEVQMATGYCIYHYPDDRQTTIMQFPRDVLHGKMYRRSFIEKYNLSFNGLYSYMHEDKAFSLMYLMLVYGTKSKIGYVKEPVYIYNYQNGISSQLANDSKYFIESLIHNLLAADAKILATVDRNEEIDGNIIDNMIQCYYFYLETLSVDPDEEFYQREISKKYYEQSFKKVAFTVPPELVHQIYYYKTRSLYATQIVPFIPRISFFEFLYLLGEGEDDLDTRTIIERLL